MNNLPFGNHNHSFDAEAQFPGTKIKMEVLKTKEKSKDPKSLCESEHIVSIGISPPPTKDSPIIPFESSIVVVFTALDSSGAGYIGEILDPVAIGGGIKVLFTDPVKYANTIQAGKEGALNNLQSNDTSVAKKTESLFFLTLTGGVSGFSKGISSWFSAEEVFRGDNYFGTELHYENAIAHKIRIKITNKFEGVIRTVYDSEIAGSSTISPEGYLMPAISYFAVDSPGLWTITADSIGSGSCANPKLALRETFNVATPENWGKDEPEDSESEPETSEPETFIETISGGSSAKTEVGLETIIGGMVVGGALIYALLG